MMSNVLRRMVVLPSTALFAASGRVSARPQENVRIAVVPGAEAKVPWPTGLKSRRSAAGRHRTRGCRGGEGQGGGAPGAVAPGAVAPGAVAPGAVAPGAVAPGAVAPGAVVPGSLAPGAVVLCDGGGAGGTFVLSPDQNR